MYAVFTGRITSFSTERNRAAICSGVGAVSRSSSRSFCILAPICSFMALPGALRRVLSCHCRIF